MSLIKNLVKEPERKDDKSDNDSDGDKKPRPIIKSALDLQRLKLEKLMKNPEKPVIIPEHRRDKDYMQSVPSFVRNVMGSSAGAGSGEFHVYRHLRRKEYARQKMIQHKSIQEQLDDEYQEKLEENRRIAEEKTAKKRAKRLKKKQRAKKSRKETSKNTPAKENEADSSSDDVDDNDSPPKIQDSDEGSNIPSDIQEVEVANVDASTENNNCKPEVSTCEQRIEDVKNSEDSIQQETLN